MPVERSGAIGHDEAGRGESPRFRGYPPVFPASRYSPMRSSAIGMNWNEPDFPLFPRTWKCIKP